MSEDRPQTEGEYRVGVSFNPSNSSAVDEIKRKTAELIDLMMALTRNRDAAGARVKRQLRQLHTKMPQCGL